MKIDLGCGIRKREGFIGVDSMNFPGVDVLMDAFEYLATLKDESVDEINMEHFVEHFDGADRVKLFNECFRVLSPSGKINVTCPSWSHERAYGDPTHKWPPVSQWTFIYLNKEWRDINAPHCGYTCDFNYSLVGSWDPTDAYIQFRSNEVKQDLMAHNINITADIIATLNKRRKDDSESSKS